MTNGKPRLHLQIVSREPAGTEETRLDREKWRARLASGIGRSNAAMGRALDSLATEGDRTGFGSVPLPPVSLDPALWESVNHESSRHDTRPRAEHRPIDLPSTRWDGRRDYATLSDIQRRALLIEGRLRQVEGDVILHKMTDALVEQAYIYRKEIRSHTAGYNRANLARSKAQAQGLLVRQQAQLYAICRSRMMHSCSDTSAAERLELRYRVLREDEIRCDTSTYDPTGNQLFELPWFWRLDRGLGEDDDTYLSKSEPVPSVLKYLR